MDARLLQIDAFGDKYFSDNAEVVAPLPQWLDDGCYRTFPTSTTSPNLPSTKRKHMMQFTKSLEPVCSEALG